MYFTTLFLIQLVNTQLCTYMKVSFLQHNHIHIHCSGLSNTHVLRPGLPNLSLALAPFVPNKSRTCLVISQRPLDPQRSMTYQFVSTFYDKPISFVRIIVESLTNK